MEMKAAYFHAKTHHFPASIFIPSAVSIPVQKQKIPVQKQKISLRQESFRSIGLRMKCRKGGLASELEKRLGDDVLNIEEELMVMGEKCRGANGIAELLECLEREAIMGEDEGREASDYLRRAQIFDKSSRVFQALRESNSTVS